MIEKSMYSIVNQLMFLWLALVHGWLLLLLLKVTYCKGGGEAEIITAYCGSVMSRSFSTCRSVKLHLYVRLSFYLVAERTYTSNIEGSLMVVTIWVWEDVWLMREM